MTDDRNHFISCPPVKPVDIVYTSEHTQVHGISHFMQLKGWSI